MLPRGKSTVGSAPSDQIPDSKPAPIFAPDWHDWIVKKGQPKQSVALDCVYGARNSFFMTANFVGHTAGAVANFEGCKTAADVDYTCASARAALGAWAKANGYESWVEGKIGNTVYPELKIFCANPQTAAKGLMILFR